jgi:hypothetical protein
VVGCGVSVGRRHTSLARSRREARVHRSQTGRARAWIVLVAGQLVFFGLLTIPIWDESWAESVLKQSYMPMMALYASFPLGVML